MIVLIVATVKLCVYVLLLTTLKLGEVAMRNRSNQLYVEIGRRIRKTRESKQLTQGQLAEKAFLKRPSIVLIEQGTQRLPIDRLYLIASALDCNVTNLLPEHNNSHDKIEWNLDAASKDRVKDDDVNTIMSILNKARENDNDTSN